jgi:cellobiose phosphorylase
MSVLAQLVEHRFVVPGVASSILVDRPIWFKKEVIEFIKSTKYVKALEIYIPFTKVSAKNQFSKPN